MHNTSSSSYQSICLIKVNKQPTSTTSIDLIRIIIYRDKNFDNVTNFKIMTATKRFEDLF